MKTIKLFLVLAIILISITFAPGVVGKEAKTPITVYDEYESLQIDPQKYCIHLMKTILDDIDVESLLDENNMEPLQLADPVARFFSGVFTDVMRLCLILFGHNPLAQTIAFALCLLMFGILLLPVTLPVGVVYSIGLYVSMCQEMDILGIGADAEPVVRHGAA